MANVVIVFVISAIPAYFLSAFNAGAMYQGCIKGLMYYKHQYPEEVCSDAIDNQENSIGWWIASAVVLTYGMAKTNNFWNPDKD